MQVLLSKKVNVNQADNWGYNALMYACKHGHSEAAEMLLKSHADINAQNERERTALMFAAEHGFDDILQSLIKRKAKLDLRDKFEESALDVATATSSAIKILKDAGATQRRPNSPPRQPRSRPAYRYVRQVSVHEADPRAETALHLAACGDQPTHATVCQILIAASFR